MNEPITVSRPFLPPLAELLPLLEDIWQRRWLTNNGRYHQELERALSDYLRVPFLSLFTNGTMPLMVALQALRITGEVITTPYSFVATTHALWWNGAVPVFIDVEEATGNLDPAKIEAAITPRTQAILPVHVYGNPCRTAEIQAIADKYGLKVIYDAAHAFGVEKDGASVSTAGDMATLSFHATKIYNTLEGGALICQDEATKKRIDFLKNFGFANETEVVMPGINGKMDEVRAAYGLIGLKYADASIEKRRQIALRYREHLRDVRGIRVMEDLDGVKHNYAYFPIFIDEAAYRISRDALYEKLKEHNILARRYFYPLISMFSPYRSLDSANPANLPVATQLADSVICLPMFEDLTEKQIERIITAVAG
ncbi:aminotransferase [Planctomycetales bacterium]|nr:aminotransferase [Planctomycetales bacterium]